jgi:hypothetical protein
MKIGPEWKNKCGARHRNVRYNPDTDISLNIKHTGSTGEQWV